MPVVEGSQAAAVPNLAARFKEVLKGIGGEVIEALNEEEVKTALRNAPFSGGRIITTIESFADIAETGWRSDDPHALADVDLAIFRARFGVAENGAVWLTEADLGRRVAPFICQRLATLLYKSDILATMGEAYERIGAADYSFGTFIAGPSKTADIEQSLVLGAHGARGMTVFLIN